MEGQTWECLPPSFDNGQLFRPRSIVDQDRPPRRQPGKQYRTGRIARTPTGPRRGTVDDEEIDRQVRKLIRSVPAEGLAVELPRLERSADDAGPVGESLPLELPARLFSKLLHVLEAVQMALTIDLQASRDDHRR